MTRKKALKVLNEALRPYRQRYTVDANLYKSGVIDPFAKRAYDRLKELDKALEVLVEPIQLELF